MRDEREQIRVVAGFEGPQISGMGTIQDMSVSGARIEQIEDRPPIGTPLMLQLFPFPDRNPLKLGANVVRETESGGFAVRFESTDAITRSLLQLMVISHPILT